MQARRLLAQNLARAEFSAPSAFSRPSSSARMERHSWPMNSTGSTAPLGSHAAEIYAKFAVDHAGLDFSAVIEMLRAG